MRVYKKLYLHLVAAPPEVAFITRQHVDCYRKREIKSGASNTMSKEMHSVEQRFVSVPINLRLNARYVESQTSRNQRILQQIYIPFIYDAIFKNKQ